MEMLFDIAPAKWRAPSTMLVIADIADDAAFEANVVTASNVFSWATRVAMKAITLFWPS